jgi:predicted enzyme related to lactoylglutathione lyase
MTHGLFEWVDVAVPDLGAGTAFYSAVFGWEAEAVESPEGPSGYVLFRKDGRLAAGMTLLGGDAPAAWTSYVSVDDVGVIADRAAELGAEVVIPPMEVSDAGRMTYLRDPQGASIAFWEAGTHSGAEDFNKPGFLTWNGLGSRDVPGSKAFYSALMPEWTFQDMGTGDAATAFSMIKLGDRDNAGLGALSDEFSPDTPTHWRVFFVVDDARVSLGVVEANGGKAIGPVVDSEFGPVVRVADPFGAAFLIIGPMIGP